MFDFSSLSSLVSFGLITFVYYLNIKFIATQQPSTQPPIKKTPSSTLSLKVEYTLNSVKVFMNKNPNVKIMKWDAFKDSDVNFNLKLREPYPLDILNRRYYNYFLLFEITPLDGNGGGEKWLEEVFAKIQGWDYTITYTFLTLQTSITKLYLKDYIPNFLNKIN
jgi:hypothetical protein